MKVITEEDLASGLESYPEFLLIRDANYVDNHEVNVFGLSYLLDQELETRQPELVQHLDNNGQKIRSEVIGYDQNGVEIWLEY